jgi:acylphosphatase
METRFFVICIQTLGGEAILSRIGPGTDIDFLSTVAVLAVDMGKDLVRVRVLAGGRVQGVAYRFFAEKWAASLDVTGWVRNLADGRVEVVAEGDAGSVEMFLDRLREGPRLARVESFEVRKEAATGELTGFRIAFPSD